jgi:hypothetical protein
MAGKAIRSVLQAIGNTPLVHLNKVVLPNSRAGKPTSPIKVEMVSFSFRRSWVGTDKLRAFPRRPWERE